MRALDPIPTAIDPPPADTPAYARATTLRQLARLERLAEVGMEIAEAAGRSAQAQGQGDEAAPDAALAFSRAARAVRLTIALQSRLLKDLARFDAGEACDRTFEAARRRQRIHGRVERALEETSEDEDEIERLSTCAWERLEDEDDAVIAGAPVAEIVARICRDLGLPMEWGGGLFAQELETPSPLGVSGEVDNGLSTAARWVAPEGSDEGAAPLHTDKPPHQSAPPTASPRGEKRTMLSTSSG